MKEEIKYIGFYDKVQSSIKRAARLTATNKMDYICNALNRSGLSVHIISPSWITTSNSDKKYLPQLTEKINDKNKFTLCPSMATTNNFTRNLNILLGLSWLFLWLIFNVKRKEKILVYHSPWLALPLIYAKKIKGFKIVLEVEEIYSEVWQLKNVLKNWEKKLLSNADNYIAVSDVLAKKLGAKTSIIIYGNYSLPNYKISKANNQFINIVYAGLIDNVKGGAYNAVECAKYLPENYVIHISGFGGDEEIKKLEKKIFDTNKSLGREACIYHGLIPDNKFSDFLFQCQIAINPQFDGENMTTLFPSKLLKYLSHNLRVVSTRIKSVDKSLVAPLINFSDNPSPEANANAIKKIDLNEPYDSRDFIKRLDNQFTTNIGNLMN